MNIFEDFFTWRGRLNRQPHIIRGIVLGVIMQVLISVIQAKRSEFSTSINFLAAAILFTLTALILMQIIKRCHDINLSGWYALIACIPIVNLIFGLYLAFKKGTTGNNRFGEDPLARVAS